MMEYLSRVRREYHTAILDKRGSNISDFSLISESAVKEILERIDATERDASFTAQSAAIARMMTNASASSSVRRLLSLLVRLWGCS